MANENVSLVVSRIILSDVATSLSKLPDETSQEVAHYILEKVIKLKYSCPRSID